MSRGIVIAIMAGFIGALVAYEASSRLYGAIIHPEQTPLSTSASVAGRFDTYFSRDGQHPDLIVANDVHNATREVVTAMYSFTQPSIWAEYTALPARHVALTLITDQEQLALNKVQQAGVANLCSQGVKVHKNIAKGRELEHMKATVIDGRVALWGSYNYTVSATGSNATESNANDEILTRYVSPTYAAQIRDHIMRTYNDPNWATDACATPPTLVPSPAARANPEGD